MAKDKTTRNDGQLGGVDFRATGSESASGDSNSNAGNDSGNSADDIGAGNDGAAGNAVGDTIAGFRTADPSSVENDDDSARWGFKPDGTPRGKPGRKPGSGSSSRPSTQRKSTQKAQSNSGLGLEKLLYSLHAMAAVALKTPEAALTPQEAKHLGDAIGAVQAHYGFDVSEETAIWVNLVTAVGTIYGPRAVLIYQRKQKETREKKRPLASVTSIFEETTQSFSPGIHDRPLT